MECPYKDGAPSAQPKSLWTAITRSIDLQPSLAESQNVDVGIVGAGFMGLTAALQLAKQGARVAVIEAAEVGWGASGRNNGLVAPGLKRDPHQVRRRLGRDAGDRLLQFSSDAPGNLFKLIDDHAIKCDAVNSGWIQAAHSRSALGKIERRVKDWQALDAKVSMIPQAEVASRLGTDYYIGASLDSRGGSLNPLALARGLARLADAAGARVYAGTPMIELERDGGRWSVRTPNGSLGCENVLLCTNAYGSDIRELHGSVIPLRTAQVATAPLDEQHVRRILPGGEAGSDTQRLLTSFRITPDYRLIMGGASATAGDEHDGLFRHLHRAASQRFPYLGAIRWQYGWSGYLALTGDQLPVIQRLARGVYSGIGCNGRGIAMSAAIGQLLTNLLSGANESESPVPVRPVRRMATYHLRRPGIAMAVMANRLLDRFGRKLG
jgi:glycine/D-amino acid oxidase-like deaminating enzyme